MSRKRCVININIVNAKVKYTPRKLYSPNFDRLTNGYIISGFWKETSGSPYFCAVQWDNGIRYTMCVQDLKFTRE